MTAAVRTTNNQRLDTILFCSRRGRAGTEQASGHCFSTALVNRTKPALSLPLVLRAATVSQHKDDDDDDRLTNDRLTVTHRDAFSVPRRRPHVLVVLPHRLVRDRDPRRGKSQKAIASQKSTRTLATGTVSPRRRRRVGGDLCFSVQKATLMRRRECPCNKKADHPLPYPTDPAPGPRQDAAAGGFYTSMTRCRPRRPTDAAVGPTPPRRPGP